MDTQQEEELTSLSKSLDFEWLFVSVILVILMQAGFAAYEVGAIRATDSKTSILKKNIGDATISLIAWILLGYALSSGKDQLHLFGGSYFGLKEGDPFEGDDDTEIGESFLICLFRWSFAATCTTIVSGAVADRIYVKAYFIYAFLTSAFFYPILAHVVWAEEGWLSPTRTSGGDPDAIFGCGVIDFAGSGVVHMLGGLMSLAMAKFVENRSGRFPEATGPTGGQPGNHGGNSSGSAPPLNEQDFQPSDPTWMTLGCLLLWLGWYGFNCGSTGSISTEENRNTAGRVAMNTTIGAAIGSTASMIFEVVYHVHRYLPEKVEVPEPGDRRWYIATKKTIHGAACNGLLAGLVGITAGCATMGPWVAIGVSVVSALVYHMSYRIVLLYRIDDAVGAFAVHGMCGMWGVWAAGLFVDTDAREDLGYLSEDCTRGNQIGANFLLTFLIVVYAAACVAIIRALLGVFGLFGKTRDDHAQAQGVDPEITKLENYIDGEVDAMDKVIRDLKERVGKLEKDSKPQEVKEPEDV